MTEAYSQQKPSDSATEYATIQFVVQSILSRVATATLVRVDSCTNNGGLSPWGFVNVQPVISQVSGNNVAVQHGKLFRLPYLRLQGGTNAVIIDPAPGDVGLAVFCARDIGAAKDQGNLDQIKSGVILGVPPSSGRQYSMADGIYVGGMLNAQPVQYVRFSSGGVEIVSPTKITLQAPDVEIIASDTVSVQATTSVTVTSPDNTLSGTNNLTGTNNLSGGVTTISGGTTSIDGKNFLGHTHGGVQSGSSDTGGVT